MVLLSTHNICLAENFTYTLLSRGLILQINSEKMTLLFVQFHGIRQFNIKLKHESSSTFTLCHYFNDPSLIVFYRIGMGEGHSIRPM